MHATLQDCRRLVADGRHNAFVSLCHWRGHWYCAYRQAQSHGQDIPGCVVIQRSADWADWELCAVLHTGGDDRDPKLLALDDQLAVYFATYYPRWGKPAQSLTNSRFDLISHLATSLNGTTWSIPWQVYRPNYWLWSMARVGDVLYGAAYHVGQPLRTLDRQTVHLIRTFTDDLVYWRLQYDILANSPLQEAAPSEPALFREGTHGFGCVIRTTGDALLGRSRRTRVQPWREWEWTSLKVPIHAAAVCQTPHGLVLAGRHFIKKPNKQARRKGVSVIRPAQPKTTTDLWALEEDRVRPLLTLPSWGDCSYPGLVWDEDAEVLRMAYYSQHAYKDVELPWPWMPADVYLAEITLEK